MQQPRGHGDESTRSSRRAGCQDTPRASQRVPQDARSSGHCVGWSRLNRSDSEPIYTRDPDRTVVARLRLGPFR
eukprot:748811-Hanusia_phi.AAC.1